MVKDKFKFIAKMMILAFGINLITEPAIKSFATTKTENVIISEYESKKQSLYGPYDSNYNSQKAYDPFSDQINNEDKLNGYEYSKDTLLIKTKNKFRLFGGSGVSNESIESMEALDIFNGKQKSLSNEIDGTWFKAKLKSDSNIENVINELSEDSDVLVVEPEYIRKLEANIPTPGSDGGINEQWYLDSIGVTDAWKYLKKQGVEPGGSSDIVVAVIDTGVDYTHPDLVSNIWTNHQEIAGDGIDNDNNGYVDDIHGATTIAGQQNEQPMDYNGHGTHVAGIIAAEANNGIGGAGIAYNVKIMPIKAAQDGGILTSSDIARAIIYAAENGADVINMSFGGYGRSLLEEDALAMAYSTSVLVAAAGNDGIANEATAATATGKPMYPAAYPWVLGVMASSQAQNAKGDWLASFSNWDINTENSFEYELMAPGSKIYSTLPNNQYAKWDGTSMAAPVVSAIAALVRSGFNDKEMYSSRFIMGQLVSTGVEKQGKTYSNDAEPTKYKEVNALNALTQTPRPNVTYIEHYLFDKSDVESTTAGDGIVDAGETIDIGMVIRNHWGKAEDVNVTIDAVLPSGLSDPYVEIINGNVNYGAIGNFGTDDNGFIYENDVIVGVNHPFTVKIKEDAPNNHYVKLNVTITAKNGFDSNDTTVYSNESSISFVTRKGIVLPSVIDKDMTLTKDKYWIIQNATLIAKDVTVNVEPGTQIQFWGEDRQDPYSEQSMAYIQVDGKLFMNGTAENPIELFTANSYKGYQIKILATNNIDFPDYPGILYSPNLGSQLSGYAELSYVKANNPVLSVNKIDNCYFSQDYEDFMIRRFLYNGEVHEQRYYGPIIKADSISNSKFYRMGVPQNEWDALMIWSNSVQGNLFDSCYTKIKIKDYQNSEYVNSLNNNIFLLNNKKDLASKIEIDNKNQSNVTNNAVLNNWQNTNLDTWLTFISKGNRGETNYLINNYWGTTSEKLIERAIVHINDDFNLPKVEYNPILEQAPETTYPFVTNIYLTNSDGTVVNKVGAEKLNVHVEFNRDMNTEVEPTVTFGPDMPTTDYRVTTIEDGGWINSREWVGQINITPMTGDGYQFFRVIGAQASDNPWYVSGDDRERFKFEIITSGVESMNLQAEGNGNKIKLSWFQDDFDTLAGYNIYRSESEDGTYEKINKAIIPSHIKEFEDSNVDPGATYYYKFTVLQTDMSESDYSNIASAAAIDSVLPIISHNVVTEATAYTPIKILANVTDNVAVKDVSLYFRKVGEASYKKREMNYLGAEKYSATIEGSNVTPEGIEYYIEATDGVNMERFGTSEKPNKINVVDTPKITSISPSEGPSNGGTTVTITGTNFKEGAKVKFNDIESKDVVFESSTRLRVVTPSNNPGTVQVTVENPDGRSHIFNNGFTYKTEGVNITVNSIQAKKGTTIEVPISIDYVEGLSSVEMKFNYDSEVLEFASIRSGELTSEFMTASNEKTKGQVLISMAGASNVSGRGTIAYIKLNVKKDSPIEKNSSKLEVLDLSLNGGTITGEVINGTFTITKGQNVSGNISYFRNYQSISNVNIKLSSDVDSYEGNTDSSGYFNISDVYNGTYSVTANKNDEINSITSYDASLILQHIVGKTDLDKYAKISADVNNDGKINAIDASQVLAYSAGKIELPFNGNDSVWKFESDNKSITVQDYSQWVNMYGILIGDVSGNWNSYSDPDVRDSSADFNTGVVTKNSDGTYSVPVLVSMNNANLFGADIVLTYDSTIGKPIRVEKDNYISNFGLEENFINNEENGVGEITISLAGANPYDTSGRFINVVFESDNVNALAATTKIKEVDVNEKTVNSVVYQSKDVNGDKKIDILDISELAIAYNSSNGKPNWKDKLDINRDGIIDIFDLIQVSRNM